jgi:hypothetical protein
MTTQGKLVVALSIIAAVPFFILFKTINKKRKEEIVDPYRGLIQF